MVHQIAVDPAAVYDGEGDKVHVLGPDLAYRRLGIVNIVLVGPPTGKSVLIDAGLPGTRHLIESAFESRFGAGARPEAIVMTHGHFDHTGALESLAGKWRVPVYAHIAEAPYLDGTKSYPPPDPTVGGGLLSLISPLYPRKPANVRPWLQILPEDGSVPSMPGWRWIHTPGHSDGHISLWRDSDSTLIAGDAFITTAQESAYAAITQAPELHGPPMYLTTDWDAAHRSVETLARLQPELAVTGHGRPMHGRSLRIALDALASRFDQVAVPRHGRYVHKPPPPTDNYPR